MQRNACRSECTSRNIVPSLHRHLIDRGLLRPGDRVLDFGGGRFTRALRFLHAHRIRAEIMDPSLDRPHNDRVWDQKPFDVVLCANVLNVIDSDAQRRQVIDAVADAVSLRGFVGFQVHEGDGSGRGRRTRDGWQENRGMESYRREIERRFQRVEQVGRAFVARDPR